ncbi:MAG TPA: hypothetical protein VLE47_01555 [Candidatus Saccharimonadales bacterium]|nr:hypothetical protein [Candidatus Saccharimonadales bacterium]
MSKDSRIKDSVKRYATRLLGLGLIDKLVLVVDLEQNKATLYHVFIDETKPAEIKDSRYAEMTRLGSEFEDEVKDILKVRVTYLNPSALSKAREHFSDSQTFEVVEVELAQLAVQG